MAPGITVETSSKEVQKVKADEIKEYLPLMMVPIVSTNWDLTILSCSDHLDLTPLNWLLLLYFPVNQPESKGIFEITAASFSLMRSN